MQASLTWADSRTVPAASLRFLLLTMGLFAALSAGGMAESSDEPVEALAAADERSTEAGAVLEIGPLAPDERRLVEVPPGSLVQLDDPQFDPSAATYAVSNRDLVVTTANGGVLVLVAFFEPFDEPVRLSLLGGPETPAAELMALADTGVNAPTVEPDAAAGGELAAIVPIVGWLWARLDMGGQAQAAEADAEPAVEGLPILDQLLAQLRIASAGERVRLVENHLAVLRELESAVQELEDSGRGNILDVRAVRATVLEARLAHTDARLERDLAIDDHFNRFDYRLNTAPLPKWPSDPPASFAELGREVAETHFVEANRQFRHLGHARESLALVDELLPLTLQLRDGYHQQFEVGQSDIAVVLAAEASHLAAVLREVELRHEEMRAEAWLLAVTGQLSEAVLVSPGQP